MFWLKMSRIIRQSILTYLTNEYSFIKMKSFHLVVLHGDIKQNLKVISLN